MRPIQGVCNLAILHTEILVSKDEILSITARLEDIEAQLMMRASVERWDATGEDPFYDIAELVSNLKRDVMALNGDTGG